MSIEDIIHEASGGRARVVKGVDAVEYLRGLLDDGLPADLLKETNCGSPDCGLHGDLNAEPDPYRITDEAMQRLTSADAVTHMISATASAHNFLLGGKHIPAALSQAQAMLWESVAKRLEKAEVEQRQGQERTEVLAPQDDIAKDAPIQPPYGE